MKLLITIDTKKAPADAINLIENRIYTMPWVDDVSAEDVTDKLDKIGEALDKALDAG